MINIISANAQYVIDIVHAVSYSLLLLNTDLHVAELSTRMSRSQFVRNTLTAVQTQLQPSSACPPSSYDLADDGSANARGTGSETGTPADTILRSKRSDSITSWNSISRDTFMSSPNSLATTHITTPGSHNPNGSTSSVQMSPSPLVQDQKSPASSMVYGRSWEIEMETLLKVSG